MSQNHTDPQTLVMFATSALRKALNDGDLDAAATAEAELEIAKVLRTKEITDESASDSSRK